MSPGRSGVVLALFLAICLGVSAAGAWFTAGSVATWYPTLAKPPWNPPAWVFGPVWTVLYILMGIAAWLVWRAYSFRPVAGTLYLFLAQLAVNALWSWLFFVWRLGGWAFADIALLWLLLLCTVIAFWRLRPLAGMLLTPYLLWVSYAAALNLVVWTRNPGLLGAG